MLSNTKYLWTGGSMEASLNPVSPFLSCFYDQGCIMQKVWRSKKYGIDFRGHRTVTGIADHSGKTL